MPVPDQNPHSLTNEKLELVRAWITEHLANSRRVTLPLIGETELPNYLNRHDVMLVATAGLLVWLLCVGYRRRDRVPHGLTNALEAVLVFVRDDIAVANLGERDGRRYTPLLCTFFFLIAALNLLGLSPAFPTVTANCNVTAALGAGVFMVLLIAGVVRHGPWGFLKTFAPPGVPAPVLVLLVPIELLNLPVRCAALAIRLFANMLAGHLVVMSLVGIAAVFGLWGLPALLLAVAVDVLEVFICVLQAYIFTLLTAVFMQQVLQPEH